MFIPRRPGSGSIPAWILACVLAWTGSSSVFSRAGAAGAEDSPAYIPYVAPASSEGVQAMKGFRLSPGLEASLFAAEPLLANPVAFGFDARGRILVAETFRLHHGVTDTRQHMNWLDDDLASRSIADRVAKYRKYLGAKAEEYGKEHDRVKLVEDRDGDGVADHATVFADGFHHIPDGLGSGVLARDGRVYYACIPDLWLLRDADGDGRAEQRASLHTGYGVHTGFLGHDLHGLIVGPDGRLYFSIGDRGLNITTRDGRRIFHPDAGAVLRCELDGSGLEVFATGLRNPQELAFDDDGNLFTVDNNSDSGDRARLTYLMEGADSGWTMGWQYIEWPVSRGPWNAEKIWHPKADGQPAHIVPPLANLADGPSGLVFDPGVTRLPTAYRKHFFLADFRGSAAQSGIRAFTLKPAGAGFALDRSEQLVWGLEATDVDFGPDGALYVSDWVEGWEITGKGRIYKFAARDVDPGPAKEVAALLARGFVSSNTTELASLLGHADRRVRLEAQLALATRGAEAVDVFVAQAGKPERVRRLHGIWGLGQLARATGGSDRAVSALARLLADPDQDVRAQAARMLGDARATGARAALERLVLENEAPRARSQAAIALGKLGPGESLAALSTLLRDNGDRDPFLRHAAVMGLAGAGTSATLEGLARDESSAVRLGVLLAWRKLAEPRVARFLNDSDRRLVTEAARAIHDRPIDAAVPELAALASRGGKELDEPAWRRVVNALSRLGRPGDAATLGLLAGREDVPETIRVEAVRILGDWPKPPGRDRVTGLWRPTPARSADDAAGAIAPRFADLLGNRSMRLRDAVMRAAGPLPIQGAGRSLLAFLDDGSKFSTARAEALRALERLNDPNLADAATRATADGSSILRVEGRRILARLDPAKALPSLAKVLEEGETAERQGALATLATLPVEAVDAILARWLDRYAAGEVAPELRLDLLEAARQRKAPALAAKLRAIEEARPRDDPLAPYLDALAGGSASRGERVLQEKSELSCVRCHKVRGKGGEVGPDLAGVAKRGDRRYLLESIILPNRQIAKGFETLLVATTDGQVQSGILKEETLQSLRLITPEGRLIDIPKSEVEDRKRGASAMAEDLVKNMTLNELRDLIAFLATLD